jgi:hypothetical protein
MRYIIVALLTITLASSIATDPAPVPSVPHHTHLANLTNWLKRPHGHVMRQQLSPMFHGPRQLFDLMIGNLLYCCLNSGMPPEQLLQIFGTPEEIDGEGRCVTCTYTRYAVTFSFLLE